MKLTSLIEFIEKYPTQCVLLGVIIWFSVFIMTILGAARAKHYADPPWWGLRLTEQRYAEWKKKQPEWEGKMYNWLIAMFLWNLCWFALFFSVH